MTLSIGTVRRAREDAGQRCMERRKIERDLRLEPGAKQRERAAPIFARHAC